MATGKGGSVLFIHETHQVIGAKEDEFEAAFREGWMPALAKSDDARLLWYLNHAHGSGPAYHVVTITAFRDGAAWEDVARRVAEGDLREEMAEVDRLRHDVDGKVLLNVPWSPLRDLDLNTVPTDGSTHALSLYMEDTGWPHAPIDDYIRYWGEDYYPMLQSAPPEYRLLEVQACFRPAHGAGRRREGILLQKIHSYERLMGLLTTEVPAAQKAPGTYMREALAYRDQWQSRLLRTSPWSPLY
jgi:hypothetical protein